MFNQNLTNSLGWIHIRQKRSESTFSKRYFNQFSGEILNGKISLHGQMINVVVTWKIIHYYKFISVYTLISYW